MRSVLVLVLLSGLFGCATHGGAPLPPADLPAQWSTARAGAADALSAELRALIPVAFTMPKRCHHGVDCLLHMTSTRRYIAARNLQHLARDGRLRSDQPDGLGGDLGI